MEFKQNKIIISFSLILIQVLSALSAPVAKLNSIYSPEPDESKVLINFLKPEEWGEKVYAYIYSDNGEVTKEWPGYELKKEKYSAHSNLYIIEDAPFNTEYLSHVIFSDGKNQVPEAMKEGFPLVKDTIYDKDGMKGMDVRSKYGFIFCYQQPRVILYKPRDDWKNVYAHYKPYKLYMQEWTNAPGKKMLKTKYGDYILYVPSFISEKVTVAFNDGNPDENKRQWDNNNSKDFEIEESNQFNVIYHTI